MRKVLIYADIDLNLIDGSAIWLSSLAEMLAGPGGISVTVLQRTRIERELMIQGILDLPGVTLIDPWLRASTDAEVASLMARNTGPRLDPMIAVSLIELFDARLHLDRVIIRSMPAAEVLARSRDVAGRTWLYLTDATRAAEADPRTLAHLADRCLGFLCQTEEARDAFVEILGETTTMRIGLLPPMVPELTMHSGVVDQARPKLVYSGKFSPSYQAIEMLDAFDAVRRQFPEAQFHVIGDKFHNLPAIEGFVERVTARLEGGNGVVWHRGLSRSEASDVVRQADVGISWRHATFDGSQEISTKVLEYGALGLPVLMNPSTIQERLVGHAYPGFVVSEQSVVETFALLVTRNDVRAQAVAALRSAIAPFTFEHVRAQIEPYLFDREPAS